MKIELFDKKIECKLKDFINKDKIKGFSFLPEFLNSIEKTYKNCKNYSVLIRDNNLNIKNYIPFILVKGFLNSKRVICLPFIDSGDILEKLNKEELGQILDYFSDKGINNIEFRLNEFNENNKNNIKTLEKIGFKKINNKQQAIISLTTEEDFWGRFHKHTRNDIRKAEKAGLFIEKIKSKKQIDEFYKIYFKNMKYFGSPMHSKRYFYNLNEYLKGKIYFIGSYYKKSLIGAALIIYYKNYASLLFNVSVPSFREKRPNDFLYWDIIKFCIKNKIKYLDIGQVDEKTNDDRTKNLNKFKGKWLGKNYNKYLVIKTKDNLSYKKENQAKKIKLARRLISIMPSYFLKLIGPYICSRIAR